MQERVCVQSDGEGLANQLEFTNFEARLVRRAAKHAYTKRLIRTARAEHALSHFTGKLVGAMRIVPEESVVYNVEVLADSLGLYAERQSNRPVISRIPGLSRMLDKDVATAGQLAYEFDTKAREFREYMPPVTVPVALAGAM